MRARRDVGARLEQSLQLSAHAAACPVTIVAARWVRWASASFDGGRHELTIELEATPAAARWLMALPETELPIPGHLVADLIVVQRATACGRTTARLEVLTVQAC